MGRSVSCLRYFQERTFIDVSDYEDSYQWKDLLNDLRAEIGEKYPSIQSGGRHKRSRRIEIARKGKGE